MRIIWLTKGQFTLVDDADFDWLNQWKWYASNKIHTYYAQRGKDDVYMHRLILGLTETKQRGDHKDRNGLNNQRNNLRPATQSQNAANKKSQLSKTSKFLGVYLNNDPNARTKWCAQITKDGIKEHIGSFKTEILAALAYNERAKILHGEFSALNAC